MSSQPRKPRRFNGPHFLTPAVKGDMPGKPRAMTADEALVAAQRGIDTAERQARELMDAAETRARELMDAAALAAR